MKIKKLSLGLSLVAVGAMAFMLTSCEGSKKVTYIDDDGNEQTVAIKKTSDKDQIVDYLTAFVYSKGDKKFKPNGLGVTASATAKVSGIQVSNNKKFNYGGSVAAKALFAFGDYDDKEKKVDSFNAYAEVKASAKLPNELLKNYVNIPGAKNDKITLVAESSDEDVDYSKTSTYSTTTKVYVEKDAAYVNVASLKVPYEEFGEEAKTYGKIIDNNIVGQYIKLDKTALALIPASVTNKLGPAAMVLSMDADTLATMYYSMYDEEKEFTAVDALYASFVTGDFEKIADFKESLAKSLERTNVVISSVDGNKMTVKINAASRDPKENEYKGKSFVSVTFDINKKVPVSAKVDLGDYLTYQMNQSLEDDNEEGSKAEAKNVKFTVKGEVSIKYSPKVPTLADKYKDDALDLPTVAKLFAKTN